MRFRTRLVPVVVAALPIAGCTETARDTSKPDAKPRSEADPAKTDGTKPAPDDDTKAKPTPEIKPTIVIEKPEDIPVALGGVAMPYTPPPTPPPAAKAEAAAAPSEAAAAPAAAPAPATAPKAPAAVAGPTALALAHDHPADQPCDPLSRAEVERALADLRK